MSTPELEALLEQAIDHINAGETKQGRALLERVLEQDPQNDRAWVWLSGCVEDPMQRRICLQQALSANPHNQAALDGMQVLEGKLVQAAQAPPSLLESRLSAIGMSDRPASSRMPPPPVAPPSPSPAPIASPIISAPAEFEAAQEIGEPEKKPRRGRILLLVAVVLLLFVLVCALVATQVLPALMGALL